MVSGSFVSDIPVVVADRSPSHSAVRVSSTSPLSAARRRRRSQRPALVRIRCTRPPSAITVGKWNARSVGNKSVAINDLIVDRQLDVLAVVESWHDAAESPCLIAATPPGWLHIHRASQTSHWKALKDQPWRYLCFHQITLHCLCSFAAVV